MAIWIAVGVTVALLIAVIPRKRSWGPITYQRRSLIGGRISGRILGALLTVTLIVLLALAIAR